MIIQDCRQLLPFRIIGKAVKRSALLQYNDIRIEIIKLLHGDGIASSFVAQFIFRDYHRIFRADNIDDIGLA